MSKRDYLVNYLGRKAVVPRSGVGGGNTAGPGGPGGGGGQTTTHPLDGPQHSAASSTDQLIATETHVGLMPPLSGNPDTFLDGTGVFSAPSGTGSGTLLAWFNVMDYGATNDGSTDDTTEINAAIAAMNSAGYGVLYFPAGTGYKVTSALTTITAGGKIMGDGRGTWSESSHAPSGHGSKINFTSATAVLFTITSDGGSVEDIALVNTAGSPASNGSAILADPSDFHGKVDLRNVLMGCWYVGYDCKVNGGVSIDNVGIYNPQKGGIRLRNTVHVDSGGATLTGVIIQDDGTAHSGVYGIQIETSGGNKIIGCNIQTVETPIKVIASADSSILLIDSCSIEAYSGNAIDVDANGHVYGYIHVLNTHFGQYSNGTGHAVSATDVHDLVIDGYNLLADTGTPTAFALDGVTRAIIGGGVNTGFASLLSQTGSSGVIDATGSVAASVHITGTPTAGQVPVATSGTAAVWDDVTASSVAAEDVTITDTDGNFTATDVEGALAELADDIAAIVPSSGGIGPLLLASDHATPIIFDDILQASDGSDLLYASTP